MNEENTKPSNDVTRTYIEYLRPNENTSFDEAHIRTFFFWSFLIFCAQKQQNKK